MRQKRELALATTLAILLLGAITASVAAGDVRQGAQSDPADHTQPSLEGGSDSDNDIEQVRIQYDSTGTVHFTMRFYGPINGSRGRRATMFMSFAPEGSSDCGSFKDGEVSTFFDVSPSETNAPFFVVGYSGTGEAPVTWSADRREATVTITNAAIANRDYQCGDGSVYRPDPYGHCGNSNCTYFSYSYPHDDLDWFWFSGFGPPPPPACNDGQDNDGDSRIDTEDPGCRGKKALNSEADPSPVRARFAMWGKANGCGIDAEVEVLPDLKPKRLFPFTGRVRLVLRGTSSRTRGLYRQRRLPLGEHPGYRLGGLRAGTYRLTGYYTGDPWRTRSPARSRRVRVLACAL